MVGFHNKNNFHKKKQEQGKIYGESEDCQLDTINSDDICVGMCVYSYFYTHVHIYVCMYIMR